MHLVIVESPSKSKTIANYLGKEYKVLASTGHIRDLSIGNRDFPLGVNIENDFEPIYEISNGKAKTVATLKKYVKECDDVYLATDPDREGEAISFHLASVLGLDISNAKRLEFHEITKKAIIDSLENVRTIDTNLVSSQETRRIIDRIMGFELSQLTKGKIGSKSAGRVQSAVLKIIVDREKEIKEFKETYYYYVKVIINANKKKFMATCVDKDGNNIKFDSQEEANQFVEKLKKSELVFDKIVKDSNRQAKSYPVYTTSTLLMDASTLLKFNSKKTMKLAQSLYEGFVLEKGKGPVGLITYMRTDSVRISPLFIYNCKNKIEELYGQNYVGKAKITNSSKEKSQDAHEGIRPTDVNITAEMIAKAGHKDEAKLYQLIYSRAMASMMEDEIYEHDEIFFKANDALFKAISEKTIFDGFEKEYCKVRKNKREEIKIDFDKLTISDYEFVNEEYKTKAPFRYSEASLIQVMKKEGIGRPSTYAQTIELIKAREYVTLDKGFFLPTEQGVATIDLLDQYFPSIINIKYTSDMETWLDEIAGADNNKHDVLTRFYKDFEELRKVALKEIKNKPIVIEDLGTCPQCGKPLVRRESRYGKFIACSGYPTCKYIPVNTEAEKCPDCGSNLILRSSKFGKFYACSGYPKCKYRKSVK